MHKRRITYAFSLFAAFSISACSAFFVPDEGQDGVQRCNTGEDCREPDDNRFIAQCVFGEGQGDASDKVCSSDFRELNCNAGGYSEGHPLRDFYDDATGNQTKLAYTGCDPGFEGKRGCRPGNVGCEAGLQNIDGICDDPDAEYPAINPGDFDIDEIAGHDVKDQFCRFYFCDDSFVCDTSGSKQLCKPCDPDKPFGQGGCGLLYIDGALSTVYTSLDNANCSGDLEIEEVEYGEVNDPTPKTP